jgi:hypothetical protein
VPQIIRKTGRYYWLIVITSAFPVISLISFLFLNESSGWFHSWVAVLPSGFGFASVVTATLSESFGKAREVLWQSKLTRMLAQSLSFPLSIARTWRPQPVSPTSTGSLFARAHCKRNPTLCCML